MNPGLIRTAIVAGLGARQAWENIELFRYPPGKLADWDNGFMLGEIEDITAEDLDLGGGAHEVSYDLIGGLWVATSGGAGDDDYENVEATALGLVNDLQEWIVAVSHGKGLGIADVVVDVLELTAWEMAFTAGPAAVVGFTLSVVEIVT